MFGGQACECWLFNRLNGGPTTDAQPAHDVIVDAFKHLGDGGINLCEQGEGLFAKEAENTALGEHYAVLNVCLVLGRRNRSDRNRRENEKTRLMFSHRDR